MPLWFWVYIAVLWYFGWYRNVRTFFFRRGIIKQVHALNTRDMDDGIYETMIWRWRMFDSASWWRTVCAPFKPWRASAYWPDTRFLLEDVREVPAQ